MILPSQVISTDLVQRLLEDPSTDEVTRAALRDRLTVMTAPRLAARLDTMRRLAKPNHDPFANVAMADPTWDEAL